MGLVVNSEGVSESDRTYKNQKCNSEDGRGLRIDLPILRHITAVENADILTDLPLRTHLI